MVSSVTVQPATSRPIEPAAGLSQAASTSGSASGSQPAPASSQVAHANPSYSFDAAAGVVVIQFRDDSGKVDVSIPNQQQLKAYAAQRSGEASPSADSTLVT